MTTFIKSIGWLVLVTLLTANAAAANFPYIRLNNQTNRISDNGTALTRDGVAIGGGAGTVGTMINTGTPAVGALPAATDTTGTNWGPSLVTITNGAVWSATTAMTNAPFNARATNGVQFRIKAPSAAANAGDFVWWAENFPNSDASPNDGFQLGWNLNENGTGENTNRANGGLVWETGYVPSAGHRQIETYFTFHATNGVTKRGFSMVFNTDDTDTNVIGNLTGNLFSDSFVFGSGNGLNQYLSLVPNSSVAGAGGQVRLSGTSQILVQTNNYAFLQQYDESNFARNLIYINNTRKLQFGDAFMTNMMSSSLIWSATNTSDIGTAAYTNSPRSIYPQVDMKAGQDVTAGRDMSFGGKLTTSSAASQTNLVGDIRMIGTGLAYANKMIRVDNSTNGRVLTVTGDGRMYLGSDSGQDVVFEVNKTGVQQTAGVVARFADANGAVKVTSDTIQSSGSTLTFGCNNQPALNMTSLTAPFLINVNGVSTGIGYQTTATPSDTLRVANLKAASGVTTMVIQEGAGQSTAVPFNIVANDGTTSRFEVTPSATIVGGDFQVPKTIITAGTTGTQTINKTSGRVNFAIGAQTLVVTNSLATANSIVMATVAADDATALSCKAIPAAGQFTLKLNATASAETAVAWLLTN